MSERSESWGDEAEEETVGDNGGVGRVLAKLLVLRSASESKLMLGTLVVVPRAAVPDRPRSSSELFTLGWSWSGRNSEDWVMVALDRCGRCFVHCC